MKQKTILKSSIRPINSLYNILYLNKNKHLISQFKYLKLIIFDTIYYNS